MSWYNTHISDDSWKILEEDTPEWYLYWEEQIDRCLNGYQPEEKPDIFIQGRYYFILNFCKANTDTGWEHPGFRDFQNDWFAEFEYNDCRGINTGMKKARRKGFSFIEMMGILYYDMVFYSGITDGLGVGDDETLVTLRTMFWEHIDEVDQFFYLQTTMWNKSIMQFGWKEGKKGEIPKKYGTGNKLRMELMSKNTEVFKGTIMTHIIFEEVGKFDKLAQAFNDSEDCIKKGARQFGTFILGGTGADTAKGSKDFLLLSMKAKLYNINWTFVPATKGMYPYIDEDGGSITEACTEQQFQYLKRTIVGFTDEQLRMGSKAYWLSREAFFKAQGNRAKLYDFYQNNPTKEDHIFLTKGSGVFNQEILDVLLMKLQSQKLYNGGTRGSLRLIDNWRQLYELNGDWVKECVEFVPDPNGTCVLMDYPNDLKTDLAGLDPYFQEKTVTSDSKGVFYVYRTKTKFTPDGDRAIFKYVGRPESIKEFNRTCLYACIFFDVQVDCEPNAGAEFFSFMEQMKAEKYLMLAPKEYDEFETHAKNKYGRRMSVPVKKIMVGNLAEHLEEDAGKVWDLLLVQELKIFGTENTDHVFAYGLCVMDAYDRYKIRGVFNQMTDEDEDDDDECLPVYTNVHGMITINHRK